MMVSGVNDFESQAEDDEEDEEKSICVHFHYQADPTGWTIRAKKNDDVSEKNAT